MPFEISSTQSSGAARVLVLFPSWPVGWARLSRQGLNLMNGKNYSEGSLSKMIVVAQQYIDANGLRDSIIGKCYQELGLIVTGAPVHQRANITLTDLEAESLRKAIHQWRQEEKQSRIKAG